MSKVISNSSCASALPRDSCTAVTGSCVTLKPRRLRVDSRLTSRFGVPYPAAEPRGFFAARRFASCKPFRIVADFGRKAERPQRHRARHGLLHVGVAGQRDRAVARRQSVERRRHRQRTVVQGLRRVAQVQAQRGEHLIVARAPGVQASAGRADSRRQQILDGRLAILLFERDAPFAARMLLADRLERLADRREIRGRQQPLLPQHLGVRDGGLNVVAHQAVVEQMILAGRVREHALIERRPLVPQSRHGCAAPSCSAGLKALRSATTSVPVPSLVKISASKLSVDL